MKVPAVKIIPREYFFVLQGNSLLRQSGFQAIRVSDGLDFSQSGFQTVRANYSAAGTVCCLMPRIAGADYAQWCQIMPNPFFHSMKKSGALNSISPFSTWVKTWRLFPVAAIAISLSR